jgi:hypothetical protein
MRAGDIKRLAFMLSYFTDTFMGGNHIVRLQSLGPLFIAV